MKLSDVVQRRIAEVEVGFPAYLAVYDERGPFRRSGQLENHEATLRRLKELGFDPVSAIHDEAFVDSLYRTLRAWGIGTRASRLRPVEEFGQALRLKSDQIAALASAHIWDPGLSTDRVGDRVWELVEGLDIIENEARIVALTKTLHHILPSLVVPIDRAYTGRFLGWSPADMQFRQRERFADAFAVFHRIARSVDLQREVGAGWRMSPAKLIDNAIVGYCIVELPMEDRAIRASGKLRREPSSPTARRMGKYGALRDHLAGFRGNVEMTFAEIDGLIGGLPSSARNYREWWANTARNPQASAWLAAGKRVDSISLSREVVRFTSSSD